jgi:hypothetical protein
MTLHRVEKVASMDNRRGVRASLVGLVVVTLTGFPISAVCGQSGAESALSRPWVGKPSPGLAAKLGHWRLKFEKGEQVEAPEMGVFSSFSSFLETDKGTSRLVSDTRTSPLQLTPIMGRTRYMPPGERPTNPNDKVVTNEILETLRSAEVAQFITAEHADDPRVDIERDFTVALVQEFDVAFRSPRKKEHVWSINWRIGNEWGSQGGGDPMGFEAWGLFTRINGKLKPFRLVAVKQEREEFGGHYYYYVLAVGDLDGDGIDELVARRMEFEAEQDNLELWAWEQGGPVTIHNAP